jgi:hypothetical protein
LRDPLFLACCALYVINRWVMKPHLDRAFIHSWFNDVLLIPGAMPVLLRLHAWFGWREQDAMPDAREILAHLVGWSVLFEVIGPYLMDHTTGDVMDVVAYTAGAVLAYLWWHRERLWQPATKSSTLLNPCSVEPVARPNRRTAPTLHLNQDAHPIP